MVRVFIADTDRSSSVAGGSVAIDEALTSQPDTCRFQTNNYAPTAGQEAIVWDATFLTAAVSAGSTVQIFVDNVFSDFSKFRVGDTVVLGIGTANEESVVLSALGASSLTAATVAHSHSLGEYIGIKIFGGVILSVESQEVEKNTAYVLWNVECGDYASVMDRKIINNVWENKAPHTILYDIIQTINYTSLLDGLEYTSNAAIQAVWGKLSDGNNPTTSSAAPKIGTYNGVFPWTFSGGSAFWQGALGSKDVSGIVGVSSGAPTRGQLTFWLKCSDPTKVTAMNIRVGSDSGNCYQYVVPQTDITTGWVRVELDLTAPNSSVGAPVWTACDYVDFTVSENGSASVSLDDLRIAGNASYTFDHVSTSGSALAQFTASFTSAREAINQLAKQIGEWDWYVDYERDVHFFPPSTAAIASPFTLTEALLSIT